MRTATWIIVGLSLLAGSAQAEDDPIGPLTPEQAADAVLSAVQAVNDAALKSLAKKDDPDPWLVADELCHRGAHDVAEAFARAAPRVDTEALPAYVVAWRQRQPDEAERGLVAAMNAVMAARQFQKVVEGTTLLGPSLETVIRVRLGHARGKALLELGRRKESTALLRRCADAAGSWGWWKRASDLYHHAGRSAYFGSDGAQALECWEAGLAVQTRRGDEFGAAKALGNMGVAYLSLGQLALALAAFEQAHARQEALGDRAGAADSLGNIGSVHVRMGNFAKALSTFAQALAQKEAVGNRAGAASLLGNIGLAHWKMGDHAKALSTYEQALAQLEALGDKSGAALTLGNMGLVHRSRGDLAGALSTFQRALAQKETLGDRAGAAETLGNIGSVQEALGDYPQALSTYAQALTQKQAVGDKAGASDTLGNIGNVYLGLGDFAKARSMFELVLAQKEALGDRAGVANTLGNIGIVSQRVGDFAKALSVYEQALALMIALGDKAGAAAALGNIGLVHSSLGDFVKALSTQEHALAQKEALGNKAGAALTLSNIGNVYLSLGDFAKALSTYERALAQQEALGDKAAAARTLGNIGSVYGNLGDFAKALSTCERALAQQEALGDKAGVAVTLGNIGVVYSSLGDRGKALSTYARALEQLDALGDKAGAARTLGNIGSVYRSLGDFAQALSTHEQVLAQQEALGDKAGAARTLGNIGSVYWNQGEFAKALSTHTQALTQKEALGDEAGAARTLGDIGVVYASLGDFGKARDFLERSARAARNLRVTETAVIALTHLAGLHMALAKPARALAACKEALAATEQLLSGLGEEQGATAREQFADLFAIGTLAAVGDEDPAQALAFLESGRAGALLDALDKREVLRWKAEALPPGLRRLDLEAQAKESAARQAYDIAVTQGVLKEQRAAGKALDEASEAVREVAARIQRELKQQSGLFYPRAKTIEQIQSALAADQALVLYGLCQDEALALVLRPDGERVVPLGRVADVTAACEALDATRVDSDPSAGLEALRKLLVEPLKVESDVMQVLVSPEGPLCYLPFGALFSQTVAMTPSGTTHVLLLDEEREKGEGILALGAPDYAGVSEGAQAIYYRGRTLTPLPATRLEVERIGTTQLLGVKASESGLTEALAQRKHWRAVHFACHGLVDVERPMLSSLALSHAGEDDGFLTALEILRTKIPADLAVLSACETGRGRIVKGEGIVGLTRAFMFAGAPRVICSLWKVDDEATQALMTRFYELWDPKDGSGGPGAAAALQQAQAYIRSHEAWKHPYYWAAWVLWGLSN